MTNIAYLIAACVLATGVFLAVHHFVRAYIRYRDSRIIICPETGEQAMVEVDAVHAALTSAVGPPDIRLWDCWRWPINQNCGQECLAQLDVAPDDCPDQGILREWDRSNSCVYGV